MASISLNAVSRTGLTDRLSGVVLPGLESRLQRLTAGSDEWLALLGQVYAAQDGFAERAEQLRQAIAGGSFSLALELRSAADLQGGLAAYAAGDAGTVERILLNADWAAAASDADLERALLEELGHAVDLVLNAGADSAGDEGELFAARVLGTPLSQAQLQGITSQDDHGQLLLDGQAVSVEFAADPSYNPLSKDTDGDGLVDASDLDDDNDGILDKVEQARPGSIDLGNLVQFTYAQTAGVGGVVAGYPSRHDAASVYGTGDRNDPKNFFDGNNFTELRVHLGDIFEFFLGTTLGAGSTLRLFEDPTGGNDAPIAIYGSLGTTDAAGNANNASGGGKGWLNLQSKIGANTAVLLYSGPSDSTLNLTLPIGIDHIQIVGLGTHGGWADLTVTASVDNTYDFDNDGIINALDLDSDNDGISDLYESVESLPSASVVQADTNKDGTISLGEARAVSGNGGDNDVNKNGLWDFLEPSGGNQGNTPHNGDGDALPDFTDLDSDDDGIPDTVEARKSTGFQVNDGNVSNDDLDGDGVIGLFDTTNDLSGAGKVFGGSFDPSGPVNTDAALGGDGLSFDVNGEPTVATVKTSVTYAKGSTSLQDIRVVHFQDSAYAQINDNGDNWVIDLGREVPVGGKILLRASSNDITKRNKLFVYASDASGGSAINQVGASGLVFAASGKGVFQNFQITLTTATRYLKLAEVAVGGGNQNNEFRIDQLTWGFGGSGEAKPVYDYLDSDSDNDGLDDVLESGLVLSGVDANGDGIDDAVQASVLDPDGKLSLPTDPSTGLQLRLDNVDLQPADFDYRSLNQDAQGNPGVAISNLTVNEGSPFANYQITGTAGKTIKLRFENLGVGPGYATQAADYKAALSDIEVFSGGAWVAYSDAVGVTLDASGNALVRVGIVNDDTFEGAERFKLEGYDASGVVASGGYTTIIDDGTGDYFDPSNNSATPNPVDASGQVLDASGNAPLGGEGGPVTLDDDRPISITNVIVNEGTQWAVFTLSGSSKAFKLELQPGATKPATLWDGNIPIPPNDPSGLKDFGPTIQVRNPVTGVWEAYTADSVLNLPVDPSTNVVGSIQVRVAIQNDPLLETDASGNGERFNLVAKNPSTNASITDGGLGIILDNGTGSIFGFDNSGNPILDPSGAVYDNDLPISVSNVLVNEGSPYAVFDLEGAPNQAFTLTLVPTGVKPATDASGAALGALPQDYGTIAQIQVLNEVTGQWDNYNPANGAALNSLGELEVRVKILNDDLYEGPETFKLIATSKSTGVGSYGGLGTIIDDGTGTIFNEAGDPDPSGVLDDDRGLSITGGSYNEGSAWAFFAIAGGPNQLVSLDLSGNTATEWNGSGSLGPSGDPLGLKDFGPTLQYLSANGSWVTYTSGTVALDPSGNLRVRVSLNQDPLYETFGTTASGETFSLVATTDSGKKSSGLAYILDNGLGDLYDASGNPSAAEKDNDLPGLTVVGPPQPASEGSPLLFTITLDSSLPSPTTVRFSLFNLSTESDDYQPDLNDSTFNQAFYLDESGKEQLLPIDASGQITLPPGVAQFYLRVRSVQDNVYEGLEELGLNVVLPDLGNLAGLATGAITDDGTGTVYSGLVDPNGGPAIDPSGTPDNDIPALSVTTLTEFISEGSRGVFRVSLDKTLENPAPLTLQLSGGPASREADVPGDVGFDLEAQFQVSWVDASGTLRSQSVSSVDGVIGAIDFPEGVKDLFVRVLTVGDDVYEGAENFQLIANLDLAGNPPTIADLELTPALFAEPPALQLTDSDDAFIVDDGTGIKYTGSVDPCGNPQSDPGPGDNDIPVLTVTSVIPKISEGNSGLFRIDLSKPLEFSAPLNLGLRNGTAETSDYGFPGANQVFYLDEGVRKFLSRDGSGNVDLPVGVTTLYVVVDTTQDGIYEGEETFFLDARLNLPGLVADPSGSASASILDDGSAPVYKEDASGNPLLDGGNPITDPSGVPDDDRPKTLTITPPSETVSEGSPVVFKVRLGGVSDLPLPVALSLGNVSTEPGDYTSPVQPGDVFYRDASNNPQPVQRDGSGNFVIPPGVQDFYVRVDTIDDDVYEGLEEFSLTATLASVPGVTGTGTAGIIDDGTGTPYTGGLDPSGNPAVDPSGVRDDDRGALIVTTLTPDVSEGSTALFSVTLGRPLADPTKLQLTLGEITAQVEDFDFPPAPQVFYLDASGEEQFLNLDGSSSVTVPAGVTKLYVRAATIQDDVYEGSESFRLTATLLGAGANPASDSDDANILDDGTGKKYTGALDPSGNPAVVPGPGDNDIPVLTVTSVIPTISEGNSGLFRIDLSKPLEFSAPLNLGLRNGTAETTDYGFPGTQQVFYLDEGVRVFLSLDGSGNVNLPVGVTTLYAVVDTTQDGVYEGEETFFLDARLNLPGLVADPSGSASASIFDDGSAPVYKEDGSGNPLLDGGNPVTDPSGVPDDDRPKTLTITPPSEAVSEGSPVVFKVSLGGVSDLPLPVALSLGNVSTEPGDYTSPVQPGDVFYRDASNNPQPVLRDGSGNFVIPPGVRDFYVRVDTIDDDVYEGLEEFSLTATLATVPGVTGTGTAGIIDDGTGTPYTGGLDPSGNPAVDPSGVKDDDRGALTVRTLTPDVSEGSIALFEVTLSNALADPTSLKLDLTPISATATSDDYGFPAAPEVYYFDADGDQRFLSIDDDGNVTVPAGVKKLYVKVATIQDDVYEGAERFELSGSLTLADKLLSGADEATILDDGSGKTYTGELDPSGRPVIDDTKQPDNDVPALTVTSVIPKISEGNSGLFRIDLSKPLAFTAPLTLGLRNGTAETTDYGFPGTQQVFYLDEGVRVFLSLDGSGNVDLPVGVSTLYAVVDTTQDGVYEGEETFFLDARLNLPGSLVDPSGSASASILDDGSAPVYKEDGSGNPLLDGGSPVTDPSGVPDDDRPKTLTITPPGETVSEGSPVVFKVSLGGVSDLPLAVALKLSDLTTEPGDYNPVLSPFDVYCFDPDGNPQLLAKESGNYIVPPGVQDFFVIVRTNDDAIYEGLEQFSLDGTLVSVPGVSGSGIAGIIDDGTGTPYTGGLDPSGNPAVDPSGVRDDDRGALVVTTLTPDVSEGSTALFRVTLGSVLAEATPLRLELTGITAEGDDYGFDPNGLQILYRDASGNPAATSLDASGTFIVPAGVTSFTVKVNTIDDDVFEGSESFRLTATLLGSGANPASDADDANILDDGTGTPYSGGLDGSGNPLVGPGPADNDIPSFTVTSLTPKISEGQSGLFRIDLGNPLEQPTPLNIGLRNGTAESDDYGFAPLNQVFYLDASGERVFLTLDASGNVNLPARVTSLYVVVPTKDDDVFEGPESFFLDARLNLPGTVADPSGSATALIADDGSAPVYRQDPSGVPILDGSGNPDPDPSGTPDEDRRLSIVSGTFNEASPFVFWSVTGAPGQPLRFLGLSGDPSGADPNVDLSGNLQYRDASGTWQTLDASSNPVLDPSGQLLIRKAVVNDGTPEGLENFTLSLEYPNGPKASGTAGLTDNGQGLIPRLDASGNPVLDPSGVPQNDPSKPKDDDRVLNVTGRAYNEASPWIFWNVKGAPGQIVKFVSLGGDPSGADPNVDLSGNLQYRDASGTWQTFDASSNPVLDASGTLLIRKAVVNDKTPEGRENFNLVVENTGGSDASGVSSLNDDGTGRIPLLDASGNPTGFDASGNPLPNLNAVKDDDRRLGVSSSTVNEASPFTFFKVEGEPGQLVSLSLNPGTAQPGSDYTNTIEYSSDGGKTWTLYTPQTGLIPLSTADGTLLVRVPILNDTPPVDEPDETFQLIATNTGGTSGTGTATIVDDGNGDIYKPDGTIDPSGVPDNDALPPRLVPTNDGQGLKVIGQAGKSLWVDLSVVMADASLQNSFDLYKVSANGAQRTRIGAIGATPESGFFGDNRYQFSVGEELRFVQVSSDLPANASPDLQIGGTDGCMQIGLDDDGGDGDADDLMIKVKTSSSDPYPLNTKLARLQKGTEQAYLDLSWIGANGITLNLEVQTNAGDLNSIGLVKVDTDASGVPLGTVDGISPTQGTLFDAAVRRKLLSYTYSQTGDQTRTAPSLTLSADQAGVYAPVLSTQAGNLYTFGALSSSDRRQHVKVLGANSFAFEDAPAGSADWDYNDFVVSFQVADPGTPRLVLSADGQGLTVVGGTGPAAGLWLDLNAVLANAGNQNSLDLFRRDASGNRTQIGSIGATSRGTFMGGKELFLGVGETLTFAQNSNDNASDPAPSLLITQIGERFRVALDDEGPGRGDGDFNDLVVDVDRTPLDPCEEVVQLANLQRTSSAGVLDLSEIGTQGLKLNLAIQTDSGNTNILSFVKLDANPTTGEYSVDGVAAGNSDAFRQAVRDNLVDFRVSAGGQGEAAPSVWQLVAGEEGLYAAVLLTPDNEVHTFGDNTSVDGRQHLKVLGDSSFGFEDELANKGSDFDYNDFVVKITPI